MYIIKRIDQRGGYLKAGINNTSSYTRFLHLAKKFKSKEDAENNLCPGNEIIIKM